MGASTLRRLEKLEGQVDAIVQSRRPHPPSPYLRDPVGYVNHVLHAELTHEQEEICRLLLEPPYRVLVLSGHNVGKSFLAACLINWWYDTFDPGVVISTAPTYKAVADVLWTEVRLQRHRAGLGGFRGDSQCRMATSPEHWAQGVTARKGEAFQGRHRAHMLFVLDECIGVDPVYWEAIDTMAKGTAGHAVLAIGNPTDQASRAYAESQATRGRQGEPKWAVYNLSSLDHPNIYSELRGQGPLPHLANAVGLEQVEQGINDECDKIPSEEREATDLCWPPEDFCRERWEASGDMNRREFNEWATAILGMAWFRPGAVFESRWLGRWPTAGAFGVWSEGAWNAACKRHGPDVYTVPHFISETRPTIGCDVARYGDDYTAIHVRHLQTSLHHERHNGWSTTRTAGRLIELANEQAAWLSRFRPPTAAKISAKSIPINVDDDGVGGGVTDLLQAQGYHVRPCIAQTGPVDAARYAHLRDELWFAGPVRARRGKLDLSRIPREHLLRLKLQAMAPLWKQDAAGRRVVESKDDMKKRLGKGSPDDMDALNLAYHEAPLAAPQVVPIPKREGSAFAERYGGKR